MRFAAAVGVLVLAALVFNVPPGLVTGVALAAAAFCFWRGR
jgi:hypothetical protein